MLRGVLAWKAPVKPLAMMITARELFKIVETVTSG